MKWTAQEILGNEKQQGEKKLLQRICLESSDASLLWKWQFLDEVIFFVLIQSLVAQAALEGHDSQAFTSEVLHIEVDVTTPS